MSDPSSDTGVCVGCERCDSERDGFREQILALQDAIARNRAKRVEHELMDTGAFAGMLEHVPCAAFVKEPAGRYVYVNPVWERTLGKSLAESRGRTDADLWGTDWARSFEENDITAAIECAGVEATETVPVGGVLRTWRVRRFPVQERRRRAILIGGFAVESTGADMEADYNGLLVMILRDKPLPQILEELCRGLERRVHHARCAITRGLAERVDAGDTAIPIISRRTGEQTGTLTISGVVVAEPEVEKLVNAAAQIAGLAIDHCQLHDELKYRAHYDRLTGLPNRALFEEKLTEALSEAAREQARTALLWIDLDRFKEINDSLGHRFGDEILVQAARRLAGAVPERAVLARIGGDEFAVVLPILRSAEEAEQCAADICEELRKPFCTDGYELFATASVGIAVYPDDAKTISDLQRNVDAAMYSAKARGRNTYRRYDQRLTAGSLTRLELEQSLCHALPRSEFELFYQPQVALDSTLRGMEALLRWRHPKFGLLIPRDFVKMAENSGLIVPVGAWVLREACRQAADWMCNGFPPMKVAVNVSALQFYHTDFVQTVERALADSGLAPQLLELELTESVLLCSLDEAARQMQRLRTLGVTIAIDDFGTGYSSLSYLQELPVDTLKIDRSFIEQIGSRKSVPVIHAISTLGHSLGLNVVAEGIETQPQLDAVRSVGVDLIQGFLFGMPMSSLKAGQHIRATVGPRL